MIDSHAHLTHRRYTEEPTIGPEELLKRAGAAGVNEIIAIACELDEWQETLALASKHTGLYVAAALHPGSVDEAAELFKGLPSVDDLVALASNIKLVAYGETGLDAKPGEAPSLLQAQVFKIHLQAAQKTGLPLCLHTRGAEDLTLEILQQFEGVNFVYHCFTGTAAQAQNVLAAGGYISLSGIVTFTNAKELQAVAKTIPLNRLLLETDAPYLAPVPFRGKRNEPALVAETYKFMAMHLGLPLEQLTQQVATNFRTLFPRAKIL